MRIFVALLAVAGCRPASTTGPGEVTWDRDTCAHCEMILSDRRFAAQVRDSQKRRLHYFDDIGCAIRWLAEHEPESSLTRNSELPEIWVMSPNGEKWIEARTSRFSAGHQTPMGYGFAAVADDPPQSVELAELSRLIEAREDERRQPGR